MKRKKEDVPKKNLLNVDDDFFADVALSFSNFMELVEACDWDENLAQELLTSSIDKLVDIIKFTEYDKSIIDSQDSLEALLRTNIQDVSDAQFNAIKKLIVAHIKYRAQQIHMNEHEHYN